MNTKVRIVLTVAIILGCAYVFQAASRAIGSPTTTVRVGEPNIAEATAPPTVTSDPGGGDLGTQTPTVTK